MLYCLLFGIISLGSLFGQNQSDITGKWLTEDQTMLDITFTGQTYTVVHIQSKHAKERSHNGKVIAKELQEVSNGVFKGTVIDPDNGKTYKAMFYLSGNKNKLTLTIREGFLSYNEVWKRL